MIVKVSPRAERSILKIGEYISKKGYPENAFKFLTRLGLFIKSLSILADKYPLCRNKSFAKRSFQCVPFEHNYIIIYKVEGDIVLIKNVVHAKRIH